MPWAYVISDLNCEEIAGTFCRKELFKAEKVIKTKDKKLYVKWKCYDNSFNSWIAKKDIAI